MKRKQRETPSSIRIQGTANVVGNNNITQVAQTNTQDAYAGHDATAQQARAPTPDQRAELLALLRDMRARIARLELNASEKEALKGNLTSAEKMAVDKAPPKEKLLDKLTTTQKMLEAAQKTVEAAKGIGAAVSIAALAQKAAEALQMAQQWWR